jgi:hypothetical protein
MFQLDESLPVSVAVISIKEKQIAVDPGFAQDLVLLVAQSSKLIASIPDDDGSMHSYSFFAAVE